MEKQHQKEERNKEIQSSLRHNIEKIYKKKIELAIKDKNPRVVPYPPDKLDDYLGYKHFKLGTVAFEARAGNTSLTRECLEYKSYWMFMVSKMVFVPDLYEEMDPGYYSHFHISSTLADIEDFQELPEDQFKVVLAQLELVDKLTDDLNIDHNLWQYRADISQHPESFDYQLPVEDILDLFLEA